MNGAMPPAAAEDGETAQAAPAASPPVIRLDGVSKSFGATRANDDLTLAIRPGEVVGLVGANGAGKSTLMRLICGLTRPDSGRIAIGGIAVDLDHFSPNAARAHGIRIVHQELSLCTNLTVAENFMLEEPAALLAPEPAWRERFGRRAKAQIEAIFPAAGLGADEVVDHLPIGQRQMVEIVRAAAGDGLRLLVLDEPTSSLDAGRSAQLRRWSRARAAEGVAIIFISHKLQEILDVASRVVVMRNGRVVADEPASRVTVTDLVERMGGHPHEGGAPAGSAARPDGEALVTIAAAAGLADHAITLAGGEIVGLSGLDGNGQRDFLHALLAAGRRHDRAITCRAEPGFVSGDRAGEGVFRLWSVLENIAIGASVDRPPLARLSPRAEQGLIRPLLERLRLADARLGANILDLSGGNQQKVLAARALLRGSRILLLDDPTRGVDVEAKAEFYRLVREVAAAGTLVVWYSTEDAELLECSRVLVFRAGRVITELRGATISAEALVGAAFAGEKPAATAGRAGATHRRPRGARLAPMISLIAVLAVMVALNPGAASPFGLDLLLGPALPVALVALGQMFVVGGSEIDLGIGPFAGLVSVLAATLLVSAPLAGGAVILLAIGAYALMGTLIQARQIPSIVVTLGASFVWTGIGYTLQPTPGGSSPAWLAVLVDWNLPFLPTAAALLVLAALAALALDRARAGVVLRGFGNDPRALRQAGWSAVRAAALRFAIAGSFAAIAGLSLTAVNTASDINAGDSFTLLSIAAVVIGGCRLFGGSTAPVGVVCGAVTLSLIGALLGFLGISTDFNAAVQGALLLGILVLRTALSGSAAAR